MAIAMQIDNVSQVLAQETDGDASVVNLGGDDTGSTETADTEISTEDGTIADSEVVPEDGMTPEDRTVPDAGTTPESGDAEISTELPSATENTEIVEELANTESVEDTENSDSTEAINTVVQNIEMYENEAIELFDVQSSEDTENDITVNVKIEGVETGAIEIKNPLGGDAANLTVDTNGQTVVASKEQTLTLNVAKLNGLRITYIKWENAEAQEILTQAPDQEKITVAKEKMEAAQLGCTLYIGVDYCHFNVRLEGGTDSLSDITLTAAIPEMQATNKEIDLQGEVSGDVPIAWDAQSVQINFKDLVGLRVEGVSMEGATLLDEDWSKNAQSQYGITLNNKALEKIRSGSCTLVISVSVSSSFVVEYKAGAFVRPAENITLINGRYATVTFEEIDNKLCVMKVTCKEPYCARQVCEDGAKKNRPNVKMKQTNHGLQVDYIRFFVPGGAKTSGHVIIEMVQDSEIPEMEIEGEKLADKQGIAIYKDAGESYDLAIKATDAGVGVARVTYSINESAEQTISDYQGDDTWVKKEIIIRETIDITICASDYYGKSTTAEVAIIVDSTPPQVKTDTVTTEDITVVKDTKSYWRQSGANPALKFDVSEENGPVSVKYKFQYKLTEDGMQNTEGVTDWVETELVDVETGSQSATNASEDGIKLVSAEELQQEIKGTTPYLSRRLTLNVAEAFEDKEEFAGVSDLKDLPDGEYSIVAVFNDATKKNETDEIALTQFVINTKLPTMQLSEDVSSMNWIKEATEPVTVTAGAEAMNPVAKMQYAVVSVSGEDVNATLSKDDIIARVTDWKNVDANLLSKQDGHVIASNIPYTLEVDKAPEGTTKYYLLVKDGLGNITHSAPIVYNIDKTSPTYQNFSVEADLNPAQRIFRYIFGTFTNKEETLTLKIDALDPYGEGAYYATGEGDEQPAVSKATLYYVDDDTVETTATTAGEIYEWLKENKAAEAVEATSHEGNTYSFNLKVDENNKFYRLYFAFEDKAGNITIANVAALDDGSGTYKLTKYMVDDTAPVIESKIQDASANADYQEKDGEKILNWYAGAHEVAYDIKVTDEQSGIFNVTVTANGTELTTDANGTAFYDANQFYQQNQPDMMTLEKGFSYVVKTGAGDIGKDGRYKIAIKVSDNAGNTSNTTETIYIDQDEPVITHMEFDTGAKDELSTVPLQYGYFFQNETKVTVYATDYIGNSKQMGSGVQKLIYQLKPAEGQTPAAQELTPKMDDNGVYSAKFTIPAGFKGQIEVKAVDNVGQDSGYYNPKGAVVETEEEHNNTSEAKIVLPETDRKDSEGNPLYANDIQIGLITKDSRSGLKENDWSVSSYSGATIAEGLLAITSTYNEKNKTWQSVTEGDTNWNISDNMDLNLVTNAQKSLGISTDENHVTVELGITDNAGNTSMAEEKIFSIDKTAPVIEVKYDNNQALKEQYYKEKRVATITVKDANFSKNACTFNIQGPEVTISEWTHQGGDGCDGTVHTHACTYTCQVEFAQDGDYIFGFSCEDLAGNEATYEKEDKFTIDTEKPVISVHYDNNNAVDGNYYNAARTATIEIEDKNFDQTATEVDVTAALDNGETGTPQVSSFTQSGDIWSATVRFAQDGDYSIKVATTDLAGNVADDYELEEFTVDQTEPELTIGGVEDRSANKDKVLPVIYCEDNNIDAASFYISLTGANNGETQYKSTRVTKENSIQVSIADFAHKAEVDDLYTLEAGVTDLAGNETVETIIFSVNRFGSVYILDDSTQTLVDNFYTNEEQDIVVTEVNVDSLQFKEIDYSYDGSIITLQEGKDYKVTSRTDVAGWKMYEYRIDKENFASEGSYVVSIYSEDMAQNKSSNKAKGKELAFVVDKTAPSIVVGGVENNGQYVEANRNVNVDTQDNILLESVEVYVGNEMKASAGRDELLESDGQLALALPGNNETQRLYVVAKDAAGNTTRSDDIEFLITSNLFVQWYSNVPLCVGSTAVTVGAGGLFAFRKRIPFKNLIRRVK